jgi:hypothetical protein
VEAPRNCPPHKRDAIYHAAGQARSVQEEGKESWDWCLEMCHIPWEKCIEECGDDEKCPDICNCSLFDNPNNFCRKLSELTLSLYWLK